MISMSGYKYATAVLVPVNNDDFQNIIISGPIDDEGRAPNALRFACYGSMKEDAEVSNPLFLRSNGNLDYGTDYYGTQEDGADADVWRRGTSNILPSRVLVEGEYFTVTMANAANHSRMETVTYRVQRVTRF